ncbi:MAG: hypothetical protein ACRD1T_17640, partial [Acidimicrobiia bacterium]
MEVGVDRLLGPRAESPGVGLKRVAVIGCAGAGKSTFSRQLAEVTGLPLTHLDRCFWRPGWVETPTEKWRGLVAELASEERWILDGNYSSTLDLRLPLADTIVFFDYPRHICAYRVLKRSALSRPRPDLPEGCEERIFGAGFFSFFGWVWNFNTRSRPNIEKALSSLTHQPE